MVILSKRFLEKDFDIFDSSIGCATKFHADDISLFFFLSLLDQIRLIHFIVLEWLLASQYYSWFCIMCQPRLKCSLGSLARLSTLS